MKVGELPEEFSTTLSEMERREHTENKSDFNFGMWSKTILIVSQSHSCKVQRLGADLK